MTSVTAYPQLALASPIRQKKIWLVLIRLLARIAAFWRGDATVGWFENPSPNRSRTYQICVHDKARIPFDNRVCPSATAPPSRAAPCSSRLLAGCARVAPT